MREIKLEKTQEGERALEARKPMQIGSRPRPEFDKRIRKKARNLIMNHKEIFERLEDYPQRREGCLSFLER
jgi:hypothetical protein